LCGARAEAISPGADLQEVKIGAQCRICQEFKSREGGYLLTAPGQFVSCN
jgi:hypothetical protein